MKLNKLLAQAVIASAMLSLVTTSFAGSIGRSGGGGFSSGGRSGSSSSFSHSSSSSSSKSSSFSAPSKPAVAPAPATPGGIGGNSASVGVRKSEVTNGVRQDVAATKPATSGVGSTGSTSSGSYAPHYTPTPSYSSPAPVVVQSGGGFGSSFMGSLGGTIVGNALFGNHGNGGGTTVINNGTPSGGTVSSGPVAQGSNGGFVDNGPGGSYTQSVKKEYTVWSFIADVIGFVIVVALLLGVAWIFYKGFQLVRAYVNKERGVSNIPFNPTQQFWRIQRAFAEADITELKVLLGPDIVDEMTNGLTASTLTLHNVSHEVRLANNTEFSIWYKFEDDGSEVNQVWHYEKFGKDWKLNGIENV